MKDLRETRKRKKFTQENLAELAEIHPVNISNIELGKQKALPRTRKAIEEVLGCRVDWIKTERIQYSDADWNKAMKLLKKLVECTVNMNPSQKKQFNRLAKTYFTNQRLESA